jgi:hypothetical protein
MRFGRITHRDRRNIVSFAEAAACAHLRISAAASAGVNEFERLCRQ